VAAGLDVQSDALLVGALYTFEPTVLGARYSAGAFLPWVWMEAEASISTGMGSISRTDEVSDFGDVLLLPAMLAWEVDFWQFNAVLPIYAPTGDYDRGRLANAGLNYWTFDPTVGVSYNHDELGFNAAVHAGVSFNTENERTDYESGTSFHLDASVQQLLPLGPGYVSAGAELFWLDQVEGDSGSGATFGDFEGHTFGVGPVLGYVLPVGDDTFVVEARWLPEIDVKRRVEGDYVWLKLVYQF
jgi:hypothetical protein